MNRSLAQLAAVVAVAAAVTSSCSTSPRTPSPTSPTTAVAVGADPAAAGTPGATASGASPTTWARSRGAGPTGEKSGPGGSSSPGAGTASPGTAAAPAGGAPAAAAPAVTTSVTADLKLPVDLMSLRQMVLVRVDGVSVVAGGRGAQGFSSDGRLLWTTKLAGLLEIGQGVRVGNQVALASAPAAGNGKLVVQFLDAKSGAVTASVPLAGDAIAMAGARVGGKEAVVAVTDSGRASVPRLLALAVDGTTVWSRSAAQRTDRVTVTGQVAALTTLPDWAPDNSVLADGAVSFVDVRTGQQLSRAKVTPNVLEEPVVAAGSQWWAPTGDQVWDQFTATGSRTGRRAQDAVRGGGVNAYSWRQGWTTGQGRPAPLSPNSVVLADRADATAWFDPASPYPVTMTNPATGAVVAGLPAPAGLNVSQSPFGVSLEGKDVFALTCTPITAGADSCSAFSVTRWALP